ncbi:MAG TPA: tRNA wybutosine-synthesizing 3 family protein [Candidatus Nanoarchaeia archaeon]|nr:tRNA wybutosine-synthesizing 3 family protein [Candidatus Nanoarchaeia archaeon]
MNFNKQKQDILKKQDKSKKGDVDEKIQKLTNLINNKKNFYTTSSCSGRIMLLQVSNSGKKNETKWLFVSHNPVAFQEIADTLKNPEGDVWFKQEGMILHISARTIEDAEKMLIICREAGFKRAGITNTGKRIVLEIFSNERIDTIACKNGKKIIDGDYLKILMEEANKKLERNWENLEKLENQLRIKNLKDI